MRANYRVLATLALLLKLAMSVAFAQGAAVPWIVPAEQRDCTRATVGTSVSCGLLRVLAIGGDIRFASAGPYSLSQDTADYFIVPTPTNGCAANQTVPASSSCFVGEVFFRPTSTGNKILRVTTRTSVGTPDSMMYGSTGSTYAWTSEPGWGGCVGGTGQWTYSSWSPTEGCGATPQT